MTNTKPYRQLKRAADRQIGKELIEMQEVTIALESLARYITKEFNSIIKRYPEISSNCFIKGITQTIKKGYQETENGFRRVSK